MPDTVRESLSAKDELGAVPPETPLVSLVVPCRSVGAAAADSLVDCCHRLRQEVPRCRILVAPIGETAARAIASVATRSPESFDQLLPTSRTVWDAALLAAESSDSTWIGVLSEASGLNLAELCRTTESIDANHVAVLEPLTAEASWFARRLSGAEWCVSALLYGPRQAVARGAVVLATHDDWQTIHSSSTTPLTLPECLASFVDHGAAIIRIAAADDAATAAAAPVTFAERISNISDVLRGWWNRRQFTAQPPRQTAAADWSWMRWAILLGLAAVVLFTNLNTPLLEPDEGRHAEIAREMWVTGDWLAPQFQYEPYLDKPPLLYWLSCLSFAMFGVHDWSTRLVTAGCGLMTVLTLYGMGRRLVGDRAAWMGAVILVLSLGFVTCARFLILESVLTMCVVTALLWGARADLIGSWSWRWWLASAGACGLGLLTKGPIAAVLIVPPLVAHHWLTSSPGPGFWRRWIPYGLIACSIAVPWFVAVVATRPEFLQYFFWQHNLNRFLSGTNHEHSLLFYVPVVLIGLIPWTLLLFPSAGFVWSRDSAGRSLRTPTLGFLSLWAGWCLAFFTAAAGKLPYYILSSLPALTLLMGYYLDRVLRFWSTDPDQRLVAMRRIRRGSWMVALVGLGIAPVMLLLGVTSATPAIAMTFVWILMLAALGRVPVNRSPALSWGLFCLIAVIGVMQLTHTGLGGWQERFAVLPKTTRTLATLRDPSTQVICVGATWGSVPFYLQRDDVVCVEIKDLSTLPDVIDPTKPAMLLVEYKLPLDSVMPLLPAGCTAIQRDATQRVTFVELAPWRTPTASRPAQHNSTSPMH